MTCEYFEDKGPYDFCKASGKAITKPCLPKCEELRYAYMKRGRTVRVEVGTIGEKRKYVDAIAGIDTYGDVLEMAGYNPDDYIIRAIGDGVGHKHYLITPDITMLLLTKRNNK